MVEFAKTLKNFFPQLLLVLGMVGFHIFSTLVYEPAGIIALLETGQGVYANPYMFAFNLAISSAIMFLTLAIFRTVYYFLRNSMVLNYFLYGIFCFMEAMVTCAFCALYFTLLTPENVDYFSVLGKCIRCIGGFMVYPYLIHALFCTVYYYIDKPELPAESVRLKFYDNRRVLKFITSSESVLYIESNLNYIIINYVENGAVRKFVLRNTMKSVESMCESVGFVRTHRSFIVNPQHVRMIRKDANGFYFADLDVSDCEGVPVSKNYYSNVTSVL